jgi:hypothetical protein
LHSLDVLREQASLVIGGVVNEQGSILSPARIIRIKHCSEFLKEELYSETIVRSAVPSEVDVSSVRDCHDQGHLVHPLTPSHHCLSLLVLPTVLGVVSCTHNALVDVDNHMLSLTQVDDVLSCCSPSIRLASLTVHASCHCADPSVGEAQLELEDAIHLQP